MYLAFILPQLPPFLPFLHSPRHRVPASPRLSLSPISLISLISLISPTPHNPSPKPYNNKTVMRARS
ncbi:MAG: hypothetical protein SWY16_07385 [Cyanobacteriota bacterium]|nr:hypothetical protein [Cyanobacteriota bacterium]